MENAIFDENKGVYRVNNFDGTFETYTPAQFAELGGEVANEEEEGIVVPSEPKEMILGESEVDSVQEVPVELGDSWVKQGLAVKETAPEEKTGIMSAIKNVINK